MKIPREQLLSAIAQLGRRYTELEHQAAELAGAQAGEAYQQAVNELSLLRDLVMTYRTYRLVERDAAEAEAIAHAQGDLEMRELAKDEAASLRLQQVKVLAQLEQFWTERHETPERPLIIEIRAGTGGLEASLFVADLYRMYTKYASKVGLKVESMHGQPSEAGGFKEVAFAVNGPGCWQRFQYESGVHR